MIWVTLRGKDYGVIPGAAIIQAMRIKRPRKKRRPRWNKFMKALKLAFTMPNLALGAAGR